jgi:pimeloyl-ACP methyl ester carboxylesterase
VRFHVRAYVQTERTLPKLIAQLESHFRVLTLQDGQAPIIVGHSWGATLALLYAAAHAPRPKLLPPKIIVLGSAPLELDTKALFRANLTARIPAKVQAELDRLDEEYDGSEDPALRSRLQIQYQDFITPFYNVDPESTKRLPHSVWDTVLFDAVSEELNAIIEAGTIPKLLSRITVPVVSFHGASDPIPHLQTQAFLRENLRIFRAITYVGAGHFPWVEPNGIAERYLANLAAEIARG